MEWKFSAWFNAAAVETAGSVPVERGLEMEVMSLAMEVAGFAVEVEVWLVGFGIGELVSVFFPPCGPFESPSGF